VSGLKERKKRNGVNMARPKAEKTEKTTKSKSSVSTKDFESMADVYKDFDEKIMFGKPEVWLDTGHPGWNDMLGGGIPRGKFIEYVGQEGAGKSTIALQQAVLWASQNIPVFYLDFEKAVTPSLCRSVGAVEHIEKTRNIIILKPTTFSDFEDIFQKRILKTPKSMHPPVVIVDSVASILSSKLDTSDIEDATVGQDSLIQTRLVRKYNSPCAANDITIIWLNQIRANIDMKNPNSPKDKPYGGKAYGHFLDIRVKISIVKKIFDTAKDDGISKRALGNILSVDCFKNKFCPPYKKYEMQLLFGHGISVPRYLHETLNTQTTWLHTGGGIYTLTLPGVEEQKFPSRAEFYSWLNMNSDDVVKVLQREKDLFPYVQISS